ncbi:MAG: guanylate kinase [Azospirillum brasilense]|nr:MAG: guanylate kinase [Azospirillum brasilense]
MRDLFKQYLPAELADKPTRRGLMFVLSSPSGAGKTTLSRKLLEEEKQVSMSVSVTTRKPRPGEVDGVDYYFVDEATFDAMVARDELLEHAIVFDNKYGTPKKQVMQALDDGRDVLFDIDWQGTRQLAKTCPEDLVSVFILPPSLSELEERLRRRAQDSEEVVQKRMARAIDEISHWEEYDYVTVNDNLEYAMRNIQSILYAERFKRWRQLDIRHFVNALCDKR